MAITDKEEGVWSLDQVYNKINQGGIWGYDGASTLWGWGTDAFGALGLNSGSPNIKYSSPVQIGGSGWSSLPSAPSAHIGAFAIKTDGTLWSWGYNDRGQLGINLQVKVSSPMQVGSPGETAWAYAGTCRPYTGNTNAVKTDGTLWAWGFNLYGPLGLNQASPVNISSPTQVGTDTTWSTDESKMGRGFYHQTAIKTDGSMWVWGYNMYGELGLNAPNYAYKSSPTQLGTDATWAKAANYDSSTTAIKTDGSLWVWGYNGYGQLGLNTGGPTIRHSSPVQVGTATDWSQVSMTGSTHAIKTNGTLWSWGYNRYGSLGLNAGDTVKLSSPTQVGTNTDWSVVRSLGTNSAAGGNTLAIKTDGTLWSWGYGTGYGTLGQNQAIGYSSPVQIPGTWASIGNGRAAYAIRVF